MRQLKAQLHLLGTALLLSSFRLNARTISLFKALCAREAGEAHRHRLYRESVRLIAKALVLVRGSSQQKYVISGQTLVESAAGL